MNTQEIDKKILEVEASISKINKRHKIEKDKLDSELKELFNAKNNLVLKSEFYLKGVWSVIFRDETCKNCYLILEKMVSVATEHLYYDIPEKLAPGVSYEYGGPNVRLFFDSSIAFRILKGET